MTTAPASRRRPHPARRARRAAGWLSAASAVVLSACMAVGTRAAQNASTATRSSSTGATTATAATSATTATSTTTSTTDDSSATAATVSSSNPMTISSGS